MRTNVKAAGLALLVAALWQLPAYGGVSASATIAPNQLGPNSYEYSLTLTNTGTTPIGTFWFGWIPLYDMLPSHPTQVLSPTGWTGVDAPDSFGVASARWVNTASPLQPGDSLSGFVIDTPDSPTALHGTSFFGLPVEESYVYIGAPETDPGFAFVPSTVAAPEPSALLLLLGAPIGLLLRRRRPAVA